MNRFPRVFLLALLFAAAPAHAAGLPDTGQDTCYNDTVADGVAASDPASIARDAGTHPRQDCRYGRDAAAAVGALTKTGAGAKGFDYTRVCFNGDLEGSGTCNGALVANITGAATGSPSTDWACTMDNHTGLLWSLERGFTDFTGANTTLPDATNVASRCGYNIGWRLPTRRELLSIVHNGTFSYAIDFNYFPVIASGHWSADSYAPDPTNAWYVNFTDGSASFNVKTQSSYVRLVRSLGN